MQMNCQYHCPAKVIDVKGYNTGAHRTYTKQVPVNYLIELLKLAGDMYPGQAITPPSNHKCFIDALHFRGDDEKFTYYLYFNVPSGTTRTVFIHVPKLEVKPE